MSPHTCCSLIAAAIVPWTSRRAAVLEGRRSFEAELARLQAVGDLQLAELGLSESTKNRVPVAGLGWATLNPWGADPHTEALRGMALMQDHLNQIRDYNITRRRAALENSISAIYQPFERIGSGDAAGSTAANRAQPAAAVPQCANFSTNSRQDPDLAVVPCPRAGWTCREYDCFQACRRSFDPLHPAVTACPLDAPVCISAGYCVPLGRVDYQLAIERIGERLLVDPGTWVKWPEEVPHHTRVWVDPGRRPTFHSVSSCLATRDLDDLSAHPGRTGSADHSLEHLECPTAAYPICYNGNNSRNGDLLHDRIFGVCSPIFPNIHHLQLNSFQQTAGPPAVVLTSLLATGAEAAVTSLGLDRFDAYEAGLCKVYQSVIGSLVGRAQIRSKPLVADLLSTLRGRDRQPKKKPKKKIDSTRSGGSQDGTGSACPSGPRSTMRIGGALPEATPFWNQFCGDTGSRQWSLSPALPSGRHTVVTRHTIGMSSFTGTFTAVPSSSMASIWTSFRHGT